MKRKWLSKPDFIIILIVAVVAVGALLWQNTASADGAVAAHYAEQYLAENG